MPDLGRVGVDMTDQRSLTLNEAITLALENNKDIEVTRKNVKIAEYDLLAARGVYQPRFTGQTYYDRSRVPNVSIFSSNQSTTQGSFVGNAGVGVDTAHVERHVGGLDELRGALFDRLCGGPPTNSAVRSSTGRSACWLAGLAVDLRRPAHT